MIKNLVEVRISTRWVEPKDVMVHLDGSLSYELWDGTIGEARPLDWRIKKQ